MLSTRGDWRAISSDIYQRFSAAMNPRAYRSRPRVLRATGKAALGRVMAIANGTESHAKQSSRPQCREVLTDSAANADLLVMVSEVKMKNRDRLWICHEKLVRSVERPYADAFTVHGFTGRARLRWKLPPCARCTCRRLAVALEWRLCRATGRRGCTTTVLKTW